MSLALNDDESKLWTPVDDVEGRGFALMPGIFDLEDLTRMCTLLSGLATPYAYAAKGTSLVPFLKGENIPITEVTDKPHSYLYHEAGFFQLMINRLTASEIFLRQLRGFEQVYPDIAEFADGHTAAQLTVELALALQNKGMLEIFEGDITENDHFTPAFTAYRPWADVFNEDRFHSPHQDELEDSAVLSIKLDLGQTPWRIHRYKYDIPRDRNAANISQDMGDMLVLDAQELVGLRCNPFHNPIVGRDGRLSALIICTGKFRDRLFDWMREYSRINECESVPEQNLFVSSSGSIVRGLSKPTKYFVQS